MATRSNLRRSTARLWRALVGPARRWLLRRRALGSRDERRRFYAARQLNDQTILKQMALEANDAVIRSQAAALVDYQAFLVAIALGTLDNEQGRAVVDRIHHALSLHRVGRSARQDVVRLAAARKLKDDKILKRIARSTADIDLCWEVACELNDPDLMAEVALFKPSNGRCDALRHEARNALLRRLDHYGRQKDENALLTFILFQSHLPFKLHAFLCLPERVIHRQLLQHMASQHYQSVSVEMIREMLAKIAAAGWRLRGRDRNLPCTRCNGKGVLSLKTICAGQTSYESDISVCTECNGNGRRAFFVADFIDPLGRSVVFKLPPAVSTTSKQRP